MCMKKISQVKFKDIEINFLLDNGFLGYSFGFEGRNYGVKVPIKTKKQQELVDATAVLIINAIELYEKLKNGDDKNISTGEGTSGN